MSREIVGAKRTAFGTFGGTLKGLSATTSRSIAAKARPRAGPASRPPRSIGHVIFGNVSRRAPDAIYCARHVGLKAGIPIDKPALTVNRLCGSGFQAVVTAPSRSSSATRARARRRQREHDPGAARSSAAGRDGAAVRQGAA
jgi:acetyl-CoA acyltransferase 2